MNSQKFTLVLLTDSYPPFDDASSILNKELVNFLSRYYQITVFAPIPLSRCNKSTFFHIDSNGIIFRRFPLPFASTRRPYLKIIKFFFLFVYSSLYIIFKKNRRSLYLVHSSPPVLIPLIAILVSLRNIFSRRMRRLVLILHDLYPDIAKSRKSVSLLVSLLSCMSERFFRISYNLYDLIIVCSPAIQTRLRNIYDVPSRNMKYISNWSLYENYSHYNNPISSIDKKSHPLFLIGNIGVVHLPTETADILLKIDKAMDLQINCYLKGAYSAFLRKKLELSSNRVHFHKWISPLELRSIYMKNFPITFVSLDSLSCSCAFPSRIITALSWGSPILFFTDKIDGNYIAEFITSNGLGIVCCPSMPISESCIAYAKLIKNYSIVSKRCIALYQEHFSKSVLLQRYLDCIGELV